MLTATNLDHTLALIYDSALDDAALPAALTGMATLFKCHFADAYRRMDDYSAWHGVQRGLDEQDYQDIFLGHWARTNVWGRRRPPVRAGDVIPTGKFISRHELQRTAMYTDYLDERGLHEGLRFDLFAEGGWVEDVSLLRTWKAGAYSATEIKAAGVLMPHLRRAWAVRRRAGEQRALASAGLAALEHMRMAMLMLTGDGRVLHANGPGEALLRTGLFTVAGRIGTRRPAETRQLQAVIDGAAGAKGRAPQSGSLTVHNLPGRAGLCVVAMPLRPEARSALDGLRASVLLCVIDRESAAGPPAERLATLFGLTPAEALVGGQLAAGLDVQAIALASGRSVNTVRSLLSRLMAKTDTNRQADLVRLINQVP